MQTNSFWCDHVVALRCAALGRRPDGEGLERATWEWAQQGREHTAAGHACRCRPQRCAEITANRR